MTNQKRKQRTLWITQTAVFLALLIVVQVATRPLGSTLITGSLVNMLLILSVMTTGFSSGAALCILAPLFAKFIGHGSLWPFIPVIIIGNLSLIVVWHLVVNRFGKDSTGWKLLALIAGAVIKFLIIFIGIVQIIVPMFLQLPEPQAGVVSAAFSYPQLITAVIGGVLAMLIYPPLSKALKSK